MSSTPNPMAAALDRLWAQHLSEMQKRVAAIAAASQALRAGDAGDDVATAGAEAHKLAGVLGSFGLHEGTALAREAETLCNSITEREPGAAAERLAEIAGMLKMTLATRNQPPLTH